MPAKPVVAPVPVEPLPAAPSRGLKRLAYVVLAYASLGCGILGLFVPGLPTTEFILLSAWAASRGSPRLNRWLLQHRVFGTLLRNWRDGGVIERKNKLYASLSMLLCLGLLLWHAPPLWLLLLAGGGMAVGAGWIWSRPERRAGR